MKAIGPETTSVLQPHKLRERHNELPLNRYVPHVQLIFVHPISHSLFFALPQKVSLRKELVFKGDFIQTTRDMPLTISDTVIPLQGVL